jgi:hypothetical protein
MKQRIVGTYSLGAEYCELVLREDRGGEFYFQPEDGHIPRIKIGADYASWAEVVSVLLHETLEFCLARIKARFSPADDWGKDVHAYVFLLAHPDFSDICGRAAGFVVAALPDLSTAWKAWKREAK